MDAVPVHVQGCHVPPLGMRVPPNIGLFWYRGQMVRLYYLRLCVPGPLLRGCRAGGRNAPCQRGHHDHDHQQSERSAVHRAPACICFYSTQPSSVRGSGRSLGVGVVVGALGFEPRSAGFFRLACTWIAHALGLRQVGAPVGHQIHQNTSSSSFPCNWSPRYYQVILYPQG